MLRIKLKYENKQRKITQNYTTKSYGSCALHSPLMRSIHPQNFITIASLVLEICTGQKSNTKTRGPRWSYIAHLNTKQYRITMKVNTK